MQEIANTARQFAAAIRNSSMYREYQECLQELKKDEQLYADYNQFRKEYYDMIQRREDSFESMEKLQADYRKMLHDPRVSAFMNTEDHLCQNLREIYIAIADKLELDMDFMDL